MSIEYQDGETVCTGTWNTQLLRFEGTVCQRLRTNDGAFLTSSTVTHVFMLYPCTHLFPLGMSKHIINQLIILFTTVESTQLSIHRLIVFELFVLVALTDVM